ncbi:NAD-dependent epimerase/dehydratase family protein [Variovorax dokdonensis]|uniref:NAD-dependent epimerase/dehydratase family protein n=1 Tax=Variovorax dokdonensis TaxID=344883 RepID=A0ABT7NB21_9BURK|nr:NAD-dependent epimerase/dehydratase family protein [Variovorax dokdonensis]MDM0045146.1 NAD-dependent epimerase/dehydratase family protein [Variovorax dokdonensis]
MQTNLSELRCVVMGGGGFVGTNLCQSLAPKVAELRGFGRRQGFPGAIPASTTWIPGDFSDSSSVAAAVAGMDVVFHLISATTPASSNVDKVADIEANLIGTLRMLEACRMQSVKRVVFVSSGGAIYGASQMIPTPEDAPTNPLNSYGISKLAIEKYLNLYNHLYGLDYRILRVSNPYGPYQTALRNQGAIAAFLTRALMGKSIEVWGDGSVARDYVYVSDVVAALEMAAIDQGEERIFNIGSATSRTLLEVIELIENLLGEKISIQFGHGRKLDTPVSRLNTDRARLNLGWEPKVDLEQGLKLTLSWMKAQTCFR